MYTCYTQVHTIYTKPFYNDSFSNQQILITFYKTCILVVLLLPSGNVEWFWWGASSYIENLLPHGYIYRVDSVRKLKNWLAMIFFYSFFCWLFFYSTYGPVVRLLCGLGNNTNKIFSVFLIKMISKHINFI